LAEEHNNLKVVRDGLSARPGSVDVRITGVRQKGLVGPEEHKAESQDAGSLVNRAVV
jgi:hypothetical protein